jgi:hypothetical protein
MLLLIRLGVEPLFKFTKAVIDDDGVHLTIEPIEGDAAKLALENYKTLHVPVNGSTFEDDVKRCAEAEALTWLQRRLTQEVGPYQRFMTQAKAGVQS